uniref:Uncharacterized protein n=1 Tax=Rhizophora mucronata TaxID=61149 RepID=A0A2P2QX62_RHIMU
MGVERRGNFAFCCKCLPATKPTFVF